MKNNILDFLFGESQRDEELAAIVESIGDIDIDTDKTDDKVEHKPLAKALKDIGIDAEGLELDARGMVLPFSDRRSYEAAHAILSEPDSMHNLMHKGWIASFASDDALTTETPHYRIKFMELASADEESAEPVLLTHKRSLEKTADLIKQSREIETTAQGRDDENNPVESENDEDLKLKAPKLGKASDGEIPDPVHESVEGSWVEKLETLRGKKIEDYCDKCEDVKSKCKCKPVKEAKSKEKSVITQIPVLGAPAKAKKAKKK